MNVFIDNTKVAMKTRLYRFWEMGYLYFAISICLFFIYALNRRIGIYDWQKEVAYFQYIKASLTSFHSIPWFWWNKLDNLTGYPAVTYTSNFVGNPETMLFSPFTPLLLIFNVLAYIKFLVVIHCLIGIGGILALRKRLQWDFQQVRTYAILFLLSPIIFQHLSIGYTPWLNLFFFPWLVYFLADEQPSSSILGTAAILGLVLLQGGTHIFVWFALLISLYYLLKTCYERKITFLFQLVGIFCLAAFLSSIRIYTTAQAYAGFRQSLQIGYNPINFIFWALIPSLFVPPFDSLFIRKVWMGVPSWDGGIFWGLAIVMVIVLAKNYRYYKNRVNFSPSNQKFAMMYHYIFIASCVLMILSFFGLFEFIIKTANIVIDIPFSDAVEKYPFRLAVPAYLGFSVVMAAYSKVISQSLDEYRHSLGQLSAISKLISALKVFTFAGIACLSLALIVSVIFSRTILRSLYNMIGEAYYGTGNHWLSRLMDRKSIDSPEHYFRKVAAIYFQYQISILIIIAVFIVAILIVKSGLIKTINANEFALALPFVAVNIMWLSLSISVPYSNYPIQNIIPPELITEPPNTKLEVRVSPQKITLLPRESYAVVKYTFPKISSADSKFLNVASKNATISESNHMLSLVPLDNRPIVVEFNPICYNKIIALMILGWVGMIAFGIARLILAFHRRHSISRL